MKGWRVRKGGREGGEREERGRRGRRGGEREGEREERGRREGGEREERRRRKGETVRGIRRREVAGESESHIESGSKSENVWKEHLG